MSGKKNGKQLAKDIIAKGLAEKKLRQIIEEQGGNPGIKPEDIEIGEHSESVVAEQDGLVLGFDNYAIANIVKLAGAPNNKKAAMLINKKMFDSVKKGDVLFTVYSESAPLLKSAMKYANENMPVIVGSANRMLLKHVKFEKFMPQFVLER